MKKTLFIILMSIFNFAQTQIIINDSTYRDNANISFPDTLIKKNGLHLIGKIISINSSQIKFQTPDPSKQIYILLRNTIDTIKYGKINPLSQTESNSTLAITAATNKAPDTILLKNNSIITGKITGNSQSGIKIKSNSFPYETSKINLSQIKQITYNNGKTISVMIDNAFISNFNKNNKFLQIPKTEFTLNIGLGNISYSTNSFKHWIPYEPFSGERFEKINPSSLKYKPGMNYGGNISFLIHKKYKLSGTIEYLKSSGKYLYNIDIPILSGYNFYFLSLENYLKIKLHTFTLNLKKTLNINNNFNGFGGLGAGISLTKTEEHMEGFFHEEIDFNNSQNANSFCGNLFFGIEFPLSKSLKSFFELQYLIIPELEYKMPGASVSGANYYYGYYYYLYINDHINVVNPSAFQIKTGLKF